MNQDKKEFVFEFKKQKRSKPSEEQSTCHTPGTSNCGW